VENKTQWHRVIAFGQGFAQMAPRLLKGMLVFVQGEINTREYERTITVRAGKSSSRPTIRILDRSSNSDATDVPELATEDEVPS
jgi:single-stranded DNA-binding protein